MATNIKLQQWTEIIKIFFFSPSRLLQSSSPAKHKTQQAVSIGWNRIETHQAEGVFYWIGTSGQEGILKGFYELGFNMTATVQEYFHLSNKAANKLKECDAIQCLKALKTVKSKKMWDLILCTIWCSPLKAAQSARGVIRKSKWWKFSSQKKSRNTGMWQHLQFGSTALANSHHGQTIASNGRFAKRTRSKGSRQKIKADQKELGPSAGACISNISYGKSSTIEKWRVLLGAWELITQRQRWENLRTLHWVLSFTWFEAFWFPEARR